MSGPLAPGLYVHVPFCRSKCPYCGFYSVVDGGAHRRFVRALEAEATAASGWSEFDTCYVGGGTPSALGDAVLGYLVEILGRGFSISPQAEWTIEVNPADVTPDRARTWQSLGFNRVSVGVQSFSASELSWLGRRHDAERARRALGDLRAAGFDNLGIDLVQGLPGQSMGERLDSLDQALAYEPEHLSCYELTLEPETPLGAAAKAGRLALPDPDLAAEAWLAVSERAQARGYLHYEVSNFARSLEHESRHNTKYWNLVPYLGLGPSAHSFSGRTRWSNLRSVGDYCQATESAKRPIANEECLTDEQLRWERISLGLRTSQGIDPEYLDAAGAARARELIEQGLLEQTGSRLIPTPRGLLVADALARCLLFGGAS